MAGGKEGRLKIEAGEVGQVKAQRRNVYFRRLIGRAIEDYVEASPAPEIIGLDKIFAFTLRLPC